MQAGRKGRQAGKWGWTSSVAEAELTDKHGLSGGVAVLGGKQLHTRRVASRLWALEDGDGAMGDASHAMEGPG